MPSFIGGCGLIDLRVAYNAGKMDEPTCTFPSPYYFCDVRLYNICSVIYDCLHSLVKLITYYSSSV